MFYLGIDIAKAKIDCCLILENSTSKKPKPFRIHKMDLSNFKSG